MYAVIGSEVVDRKCNASGLLQVSSKPGGILHRMIPLPYCCRRCDLRLMEAWSLPELLRCQQLLYPHLSPSTVERRFNSFGGMARYVLAHPEVELSELARSLSCKQALELYDISLFGVDCSVCHIFAHLQVRVVWILVHVHVQRLPIKTASNLA